MLEAPDAGGTAPVPMGGGCYAGVTDRTLGGSRGDGYSGNLATHVGDDPAAVAANREALRAALGARQLVFVRQQVHGRDVVPVEATGEPGVVELDAAADVLVSAAPDTALAVVVADCLPVLLADPVAGVICAAHAGRPGLAAGVLPAALLAMAELGARADRSVAVVGPAVCGRCYEVPAELQAQVSSVLPAARAVTRWGTPSLDLPAAALDQLRAAGVSVIRDDRCTFESPELFSHRRDGREAPTGRFAGWVMRR